MGVSSGTSFFLILGQFSPSLEVGWSLLQFTLSCSQLTFLESVSHQLPLHPSLFSLPPHFALPFCFFLPSVLSGSQEPKVELLSSSCLADRHPSSGLSVLLFYDGLHLSSFTPSLASSSQIACLMCPVYTPLFIRCSCTWSWGLALFKQSM